MFDSQVAYCDNCAKYTTMAFDPVEFRYNFGDVGWKRIGVMNIPQTLSFIVCSERCERVVLEAERRARLEMEPEGREPFDDPDDA